jgi:hypothetical protein
MRQKMRPACFGESCITLLCLSWQPRGTAATTLPIALTAPAKLLVGNSSSFGESKVSAVFIPYCRFTLHLHKSSNIPVH